MPPFDPELDDLDTRLRGAMAVLDREQPAAFDTLADRVLARLDDPLDELPALALHEPGEPGVAAVAAAPAADDDSGLHDIRSLASETKARLRRSSQDLSGPTDIAAMSSASWKAVALPEPARVVALPPPAPAVTTAISTAPARRRVRPLIAGLGVAIAAAAGLAIFVGVERDGAKQAPPMVATNAPPTHRAGTPAVPFTPEPMSNSTSERRGWQAGLAGDEHGSAISGVGHATAPPPPTTAPPTGKLKFGAGKTASVELSDRKRVTPDPSPVVAGVAKPDSPSSGGGGDASTGSGAPPPTATTGTGTGNGNGNGTAGSDDSSLEQLLKESGAKPSPPSPPKAKLPRSSLSAADIKRGMRAVEAHVRACYAGTQGSAAVHVAVLPSGQVKAVKLSGVFAGSPVGDCVARAVQDAPFPAWDGDTQSFNYSFLLSD